MVRDTFFHSITHALAERLDANLFEECAIDLLRPLYPTIVPIPGGNDAGMDGAIADMKGDAYPVICTTEKDVLRNLTKSIRSYQAQGRPRRHVIFVTSQAITPGKRRQLEDRTKELGVGLGQVYGRQAIARLLYRSPRWCAQLLGLTGEPPALSKIPLTARPLVSVKVVGRKRDLTWLADGVGDRLLVGQPGSGKTFLLYRFARRGGGLFVVDSNRARIAEQIRTDAPTLLIVDDAHINRELLVSLRQMRAELKASYSILATCWPGDREEIQEALGIGRRSIRELKPLTRDQMVKVVAATGIQGPTRLVGEIIDQAEGRPGLAATLSRLCLQGDIREVVLAESLSFMIGRDFARLAGDKATAVLAALSVGGEAGMPLELVADYLRLDMASVRHVAVRLAFGGILRDLRESAQTGGHMAVTPAVLRYALVRDFFFGKAGLPIERLLANVPSRASAAEVLVGAKARGGTAVPSSLIEGLFPVPMTGQDGVVNGNYDWFQVQSFYAHLGRREALWALERAPQLLTVATDALLEHVPDVAVPRLLDKAVGDRRPLNSAPDHSLRQIEDWIKRHGGDGSSTRSIRRRKSLLRAVHMWADGGGDIDIALAAACAALSPAIDYTESDAGSGSKFLMHRGQVPHEEMVRIKRLWPGILNRLCKERAMNISDWRPVLRLIGELTNPFPPPPGPTCKKLRTFASRMLVDLVPVAMQRPGLMCEVRRIAERLKLGTTLPERSDFDIVFFENWGVGDWDQRQQESCRQVGVVARAWATYDPNTTAMMMMHFIREAMSVDLKYQRLVVPCNQMATLVASAVRWAAAMANVHAPSDVVRPFFFRAAMCGEPGWFELANSFLDQGVGRDIVMAAALCSEHTPADLLDRVFRESEDQLAVCVRGIAGRMQEPRMARLLAHPSRTVAGAAALQEWWNAQPKGAVREALEAPWREAIIGFGDVDSEYALKEMFDKDPSLAHEWLIARVRESRYPHWAHAYVLDGAVRSLSMEHRRSVLCAITRGHWSTALISKLVGQNVELYRHFVHDVTERALHLIPLRVEPEQMNVSMIRVALDSEHTARDVLRAIEAGAYSYTGNESGYYARWRAAFELLRVDEDPRVRQVGLLGYRNAKRARTNALKRERIQAVYGRT